MTALSAHSVGRPRAADLSSVVPTAVLLAALVALLGTGCAAPAFVPGAIAATSAAISRKNPADAARAPAGVTYTATGTSAVVSAVVISRSETNRPPGVLSSRIVSFAPLSCASARPRLRYRSDAG